MVWLRSLDELDNADEFRAFLHDRVGEMIDELVRHEQEIMAIYKTNPLLPSDYYAITLREIAARIDCHRRIYRHVSGRDF